MGSLTEATFGERVRNGCGACGGKKLVIGSFVEGVFPLLEGQSDGTVNWAYAGESFVDGVFEVRCAGCRQALFEDPQCPRCQSPGGLARALESRGQLPIPAACPSCSGDTVELRALVPVTVPYEGKRTGKAKTTRELDDAGFHAVGLGCTECGPLESPREPGCPLCGA